MNGPEALTRDECWERLRAASVGHVAYTARALPVIRPVRYVVNGQHLLLLTTWDELARQVDGQVVAFEIDALDGRSGVGWSVVALGTARFLQEPGESARYGAYSVTSWSGADHPHRVLLTVGDLSGRVLLPQQPVPAA
jgi:nitroimidazol reductase NimA-like FMN-containing flavoprotein (pyridoxamine 5'-phosphate oxidase superfamily)